MHTPSGSANDRRALLGLKSPLELRTPCRGRRLHVEFGSW